MFILYILLYKVTNYIHIYYCILYYLGIGLAIGYIFTQARFINDKPNCGFDCLRYKLCTYIIKFRTQFLTK